MDLLQSQFTSVRHPREYLVEYRRSAVMLPVDPANSRNSAIFLNLLVHDPLLSVYECRGSAIGLLNSSIFQPNR